MTLSRRAFLRTVNPGAGAWSPPLVSARGREAMVGAAPGAGVPAFIAPPDTDEIRISSNENPMGPGPSAISAIRENLAESNRYPMNSKVTDTAVANRIAKMFDAKRENVVLAPGSSEILRNAVRAFCGPDRALVTGECSYENPVGTAEYFGVPVKSVANREDLGLDLDKMAGAALGAGLVFLCNPNNPTGTAHSKRDIEAFCRYVSKESPYTYILVDEAYHDYVTDPAYDTAADLALKYRNVFVSRTFSKAYGMAGLRQGYTVGGKETAEKLGAYKLTFGTNVLGLAAVMASLDDPDYIRKEIARNTEARQYTIDFFKNAGYWTTDSQTNFIFVKTNMPAKDFREGCAKFKVQVGRDFPPYEKTHARISIGTMDEMKRATEVFRQVLGMSSTDSGPNSAKQ